MFPKASAKEKKKGAGLWWKMKKVKYFKEY